MKKSKSTPYELSFEIPGTPKATNAILGRNYWVKHKNALVWKEAVGVRVRGHLPEEPLTLVHLKLVRYSYRSLDYDGLVASFKPVVDGLVQCGVLKNDTYKITGTWEVLQYYIPKGQEKIQIFVTERKGDGELWREGKTTFPV